MSCTLTRPRRRSLVRADFPTLPQHVQVQAFSVQAENKRLMSENAYLANRLSDALYALN
jgi:hypothetical protein